MDGTLREERKGNTNMTTPPTPPAGTQPPQGTPPADPPPAAPPAEPPAATPPTPPVTFTQEQVNQIVQQRLEREGIQDLRAKAAAYDEAQAANQTELEREQTARQAAEAAAAAATAQLNETRITQAIIAAATSEGAIDSDAVVALVRANPAQYAVTIDDVGQVANAEQAVKAILVAKPHLKKSGSTSGGFNGAVNMGQGTYQAPAGGQYALNSNEIRDKLRESK